MILAPGREHRDFLTLARACGELPFRVVLTGRSLHSPQARTKKPRSWPANFEQVSVEFTALRSLYSQAAVVVVSLLPADFPAGVTTLLEAMAMEKAVVVSGIVGLDGLVEDGSTALVVPPQNPTALRDAVSRLLADPNERVRLGRNARRTVQAEGSVDRYAQRLAACLRETAGAIAVEVS
jgi:glycosyltransferase involved in cell wall biosynthesis